MTKVKTSKLTGIALDWAVAKAEGMEIDGPTVITGKFYRDDEGLEWVVEWEPTNNWSQGGPIIEREQMEISFNSNSNDPFWTAYSRRPKTKNDHWPIECGPTLLIAAMRCYVASRLGDEVDVPEELS